MKKIVLFCLLLSGNAVSVSKDKECCELLRIVLLQAHVNLRCKLGKDFPKRTSQAIIHADIPLSFTAEKAYTCSCCNDYYLKDKPKKGEMIIVTPSDNERRGSIVVNFERADYDDLIDQKIQNHMNMIESMFDYYNID